MALRIGGPKQAPLPEEPQQDAPEQAMPPDDPTADPTQDPTQGTDMPKTGGMVDPVIAGYKPPEMGPFVCGNCMYYGEQEANTCKIVAGPIDEMGICNLYSPVPHTQDDAQGAPPEQAPAEAAPPDQTVMPQPPVAG